MAQPDVSTVATPPSGSPSSLPGIPTDIPPGSSPNTSPVQESKSGQQAPGGTWFVILGSYPRAERYKAEERLDYIKSLGYEAYIVDTNEYSNLRSGLWAVVMGPYQKQHAKVVVANVRPKVHDVYMK